MLCYDLEIKDSFGLNHNARNEMNESSVCKIWRKPEVKRCYINENTIIGMWHFSQECKMYLIYGKA
jgi:hypothetical protein